MATQPRRYTNRFLRLYRRSPYTLILGFPSFRRAQLETVNFWGWSKGLARRKSDGYSFKPKDSD